jgi:hypothetical protein
LQGQTFDDVLLVTQLCAGINLHHHPPFGLLRHVLGEACEAHIPGVVLIQYVSDLDLHRPKAAEAKSVARSSAVAMMLMRFVVMMVFDLPRITSQVSCASVPKYPRHRFRGFHGCEGSLSPPYSPVFFVVVPLRRFSVPLGVTSRDAAFPLASHAPME